MTNGEKSSSGLPEVRPAPEQRARSAAQALLARPGPAAPAIQGGGRGGIGPDAAEVCVLSRGSASLLETLRASGFRCVPLGRAGQIAGLDPGRCVVVAVDGDDRPGQLLDDVNAHALDARVPWLPLSAYDGTVVHVGPLVLPGRTACFSCTRRRLSATPEYASLYDPVIAGAPAVPTPHALQRWSHALAALVLLRWLGHRDPALPGALLTLDPALLEVRRAHVFRVPRCPACGSAAER